MGGLSLEASWPGDGNLHRPERHELFRQVEHCGGVQELWPGPLQVTDIDTFLASQSARFFASDGRVVAGFSWTPVTADRQPASDVEPGPLGLGMIKAEALGALGRQRDPTAGLADVVADRLTVRDRSR